MNAIEEGLEILECAIEELEAVADNQHATEKEVEAALVSLLRQMKLVSTGVAMANAIAKDYAPKGHDENA